MTPVLSTVTVLAAAAFGAEAGGEAGAGQPAAGGAGGMTSALFQMLPIILIIAAFFWLMSRSQRKRDRQRQEMLDSIKPKDDVVTIGGIEGRVVRVDTDTVLVRIDPEKDVKITVTRSGISRKIAKGESQ